MSAFSVDFAGGLPAFVFSPVTGVGAPQQSVKIRNLSGAPAYAGPAATLQTPNALPAGIPPNGHLYLQNCTAAVYLVGPYAPGAVTATISASAVAAGSTVITCSTTVPASFAAGTSFLLGNAASSRELLVVASTSASSAITTTSALNYDHAASSTISTVIFTPVQLGVLTGVL